MVQTSWIKEVLQKQCPVKDVVLGRHLLTPHFMIGLDLTAKKGDLAVGNPDAKRETLTQSESGQSTSASSRESPTMYIRSPGKCPEKVSTTSNAQGPSGKCSTAALSMQTRYNAVWNKLQQDCTDNKPEGKSVPCK